MGPTRRQLLLIIACAIWVELPAPALTTELVDINRFPIGTWINITPPMVETGRPETCLGNGLALDLSNPGTIYWTNAPFETKGNGLFKSTDYGATWKRIGSVRPAWPGASNYLEMPLHVRVNPNDSSHIYVGDAVRGTSNGFFVSRDGGETFVKSLGLIKATKAAGIGGHDIYDVAVDPANFEHVLVSFHSSWGWDDTKWNKNSGIMESLDGGGNWKVIPPINGWHSGHSVKFLSNPALGIGDSRTWLVGTQDDGLWRTTDAGENWTKVSDISITHGGSTIYYTREGVLFTAGLQTMRSTDNGVKWTSVQQQGTSAVYGDGTLLYTGPAFEANAPIQVSPESDGTRWVNYSDQRIPYGPFEMAFDPKNGLLFSSNWTTGLWVLRPR